ncbi:hypothetical protein OA101_03560 [Alphaproteobacteria bacterium]|jgi:hypothetical protein|nr:hypothetical protein [Alphaproteobacteria bacterium]
MAIKNGALAIVGWRTPTDFHNIVYISVGAYSRFNIAQSSIIRVNRECLYNSDEFRCLNAKFHY